MTQILRFCLENMHICQIYIHTSTSTYLYIYIYIYIHKSNQGISEADNESLKFNENLLKEKNKGRKEVIIPSLHVAYLNKGVINTFAFHWIK
jgi:hypothetical protein